MVKIDLIKGEGIFAEAGAMVNMTGLFQMESKLKGGIISGLKRAVAGESLFLTWFTPGDEPGFVSFAGMMPGKIFTLAISDGKEFIAKRESFLACEEGVELDIALTEKLRAGLFGGQGFILQYMSGKGIVFLHCCGDIIEMDLKPAEVVKVQTGLVVGFDKTVSYDIALVGGNNDRNPSLAERFEYSDLVVLPAVCHKDRQVSTLGDAHCLPDPFLAKRTDVVNTGRGEKNDRPDRKKLHGLLNRVCRSAGHVGNNRNVLLRERIEH
jgi:uncharacterized protein (TIGR00266 family)